MSISGLTEFAADRIFQRVGNARTITFAGSYTGGAITGIDIQLLAADGVTVVQAWTAAGSPTGAAGSWSATLSVPQGGWYRWQARRTGDSLSASAVSTNSFAVGALFLLIGQSNMRNMWGTRSAPQAPDALTRRWAGAGWWATNLLRQGSEPVGNQGVNDFGGDASVLLGNLLRAGLGVPVGLLCFAIGGTAASDWQSAGFCWTNLVAGLTANVGTDVEAAFWHQGENDALDGTPQATYESLLGNVIAQTRALSGRPALPFGIAILGGNAVTGDAATDAIRAAQRNVLATVAGAFPLGSSVDCVRVDNYHWAAATYERMARRYAQAYLFLQGLATFGAVGPTITAITGRRGTPTLVVQTSATSLREADGSADGGELTGFAVTVNGSPVAVQSSAFDGAAVRLNLAADVPPGATVAVAYQAGGNPAITSPVYDARAPQGDTRGLPLQPSFAPIAATVTEGGVLGPAGMTVLISCYFSQASVPVDRWVWRLDDGTDQNMAGVVVPANSTAIVPRVVVAGAVTDGAPAGTVTANAGLRIGGTVRAGVVTACVGGAAVVSLSGGPTDLRLLRLIGLTGEIHTGRALTRAAAAAELQALVTDLPI